MTAYVQPDNFCDCFKCRIYGLLTETLYWKGYQNILFCLRRLKFNYFALSFLIVLKIYKLIKQVHVKEIKKKMLFSLKNFVVFVYVWHWMKCSSNIFLSCSSLLFARCSLIFALGFYFINKFINSVRFKIFLSSKFFTWTFLHFWP